MSKITAEEFDKKFDNGEDVTKFLDLENVKSFRESHLSIMKNYVKIDEDLLKFFPDEKAINDALRSYVEYLKEKKSA